MVVLRNWRKNFNRIESIQTVVLNLKMDAFNGTQLHPI